MIWFRHSDPRYPFLWEEHTQPEGRWHAQGDGPVHYFADTPDGAWAEFLRHEEIASAADLATIQRALWAIEIPEEPTSVPQLALDLLTGGSDTYPACQAEARRLRNADAQRLLAPSAALMPGSAGGSRVDGGIQPGPPKDGRVLVLFGRRSDLIGWAATGRGRPRTELLPNVRYFT